MVDFRNFSQKTEERKRQRQKTLLWKFGTIEPGFRDRCSNCDSDFGEHYLDEYCPHEWLQMGHTLSLI